MSDLEICKRIAEIEGETFVVINESVRVQPASGILRGFSSEYNPLTDDALCFRLMVKYKALQELTGNEVFRAVICNWGEGSEYFRGTGETLNKAICLAIIEAHKDE